MKSKFNTSVFFGLLFLSLVCVFSELSFAEESLKIEGVVAGLGGDARELYVLINQEVYGVGDVVGEYKIMTVDSKGLELKKENSDEKQYFEVGSMIGEDASKAVLDSKKEAPSETEMSLAEKLGSHFSDVKKTLQQLQYSSVIKDLKRIHFAASEKAVLTGNNRVAIQQLIAEGMLPPLFSDSENGNYYFKIHPAANYSVRTSASPREPSSESFYFLMDEHGYVYVEKGKVATQKSPVFSGDLEIAVQPSN